MANEGLLNEIRTALDLVEALKHESAKMEDEDYEHNLEMIKRALISASQALQ